MQWTDDRVLAIDFDSTITEGTAAYWDGERADPDREMCEWIHEQYYSGKIIIIWTARPWSQAATVAARLTKWQVPYHALRCAKGGADIYIDDKMQRPEEVIRDD